VNCSASGMTLRVAASVALALGVGHAQNKATELSALSGSGGITPLESSIGTSRVSNGNLVGLSFGVAHRTMSLEIPGARSAVRLTPAQVQALLLRSDRTWMEGQPVSFPMELRLLVVKKGNRELVTSDIAMYVVPIMKTRDPSPRVLVDFSRYDEHAIKIVPHVSLLPGEYAVNTWEPAVDAEDPNQRYANTKLKMPRYRLYCFGVD
jgi:hypothetical protein